jgi:CheY-like chemotaxis protein
MQRLKRQAARRQAERGEKRHNERAEGDISELVPVSIMIRSVLVVEADPEVQARLARNLSRRGHRVVGTGSGDGALALISQWEVDLVLVSDNLPGRTGIEVARLVHQARPKATVVLMCDNLEPGPRAAARAAGATECVRKPLLDEHLGYWLRFRATLPAADRGAVAQ